MPRPIYEIAHDIRDDWKNVYFGARPYLEAMFDLRDVGDMYGYDSAPSIIRYFLANARGWRGPVAKQIKAELNRMIKGKYAATVKAAKTLTLVYHQDPGHGWVQVPKDLLNELGIADQISRFSFMRGNTAYLEEDVDAGRLIRAAKAAGWHVRFDEQHTDNDHWIRRLPRYRRASADTVAVRYATKTGLSGKEAARRNQDVRPSTDMAAYLEHLENMLLLPYPAIYNAFGVKRNEVKVRTRVSGGGRRGIVHITGPGDTFVLIEVDGKDDSHEVSGELNGKKLRDKTFRFRPGYPGISRGTQGDIVSYVQDNMPMRLIWRVCGDGPRCKDYDTVEALLRDYSREGTNNRGMAALQGQPTLKNMAGPLWDGLDRGVGVIRYDTWELFERLSR